jgi:hypothetical protein
MTLLVARQGVYVFRVMSYVVAAVAVVLIPEAGTQEHNTVADSRKRVLVC